MCKNTIKMDICEEFKKLPIENKYKIFEYLPIDIRIKLILDNHKELFNTISAYKHGRSLVDMYNDHKKIAIDMKLTTRLNDLIERHMFGSINPTIFHNGRDKLYIQHPIYNEIQNDFAYSPFYNEYSRNLILNDKNWNGHLLVEGYGYVTYETYINSIRNKIIQYKSTPLELIIKYMKSKSFDKNFDYKMHKYMMKKYILYTSSNEMKEMKKNYELEKRSRRDKMLVCMEKYSKKRESKCMGFEDKYMKKILRYEKKNKRELEKNKKKELMKERKERTIMAKEEKLTKKLLKKKR